MRNIELEEIYKKAEELDKSGFFPANIDFEVVMQNFMMQWLGDDLQAMKLICVSEGMVCNAEK